MNNYTMSDERDYVIQMIQEGKTNAEIVEGRITEDLINHYRITLFGEW